MGLVPLAEGRGVDLDDGRLGQGVGADQLVVGGVVGDDNDTGLARDALGAPREVAGLEAEGAELAVAATGADKVDALGTNAGVGRLATLLESPAAAMSDMVFSRAIGLCIPLLAVVCPLSAGSRALVTRIARDTVKRSAMNVER